MSIDHWHSTLRKLGVDESEIEEACRVSAAIKDPLQRDDFITTNSSLKSIYKGEDLEKLIRSEMHQIKVRPEMHLGQEEVQRRTSIFALMKELELLKRFVTARVTIGDTDAALALDAISESYEYFGDLLKD